ncbi:MAG TPA: hypothetical protein P5287_06070, partial [bacterium]|nr:hypothetical protein [bacterium]
MLRAEKNLNYKVPCGCAVSGIMNVKGKKISGEKIMNSIACMHDRSNGLGGGFAAVGVYPKYKDHYAFHLMFDDLKAKEEAEIILERQFYVAHGEQVPTRHVDSITREPIIWRYFAEVKDEQVAKEKFQTREDYIVKYVMQINRDIDGAFVVSSGRNLGVFKGVGYPEDIAKFYRLEEYEAYMWTAHGRFPTNTPGWWGGAHPFSLLDSTVVHNGEITSYGINKRYLESFGYELRLHTDTEVCAYLFDLLVRRQKLPLEVAFRALSSQFWKNIDRMEPEEKKLQTAIRMTYGGAMLNGPFSLIITTPDRMIGFSDRIKLRPMVLSTKGDFF